MDAYQQKLASSFDKGQQIMADPLIQKAMMMGAAAKLASASPLKAGGLEYWTKKFITCNQRMTNIVKAASRLSIINTPVVIYGETGTGKEILARIIHGNKFGPFIGINCGGLPEHLLESELFGHVKGSFSGAVSDKQGLFSAASKGTLFIDELGELPLPMQAKLLRVLQEKSVRRVGSTSFEEIDCRIVCATHRNLAELVQSGRFREDLYYRLNAIELHTIPLRERVEDIPLIAASLGFTGEVDSHTWPGNVRELQNWVSRKSFELMLSAEGINIKDV